MTRPECSRVLQLLLVLSGMVVVGWRLSRIAEFRATMVLSAVVLGFIGALTLLAGPEWGWVGGIGAVALSLVLRFLAGRRPIGRRPDHASLIGHPVTR